MKTYVGTSENALFIQIWTALIKDIKLTKIPALAVGAMEVLVEHNWLGNVRELENLIERALIINPQGPLDFKNLLLLGENRENNSSDSSSKKTISLNEMNRRHIKKVLGIARGKIKWS